jgi:hypothetical protein
MAKKNDDLWWKVPLFIIGGAAILYYAQAGRGDDNAALIPDSLEERIDLVVSRLNRQFGQGWVNWSFDMLSSYLKHTLPPAVVTLVGVIYQVELIARQVRMTSLQKQQAAANQAKLRGLS